MQYNGSTLPPPADHLTARHRMERGVRLESELGRAMPHELTIYIPFFIEQLGHAEPAHRQIAIDELSSIGEDALPALWDVLQSEMTIARLGAATVLCNFSSHRARTLQRVVLDESPYSDVRQVIVQRLLAAELDEDLAAYLLALAKRDPHVQWFVQQSDLESRLIQGRIKALERCSILDRPIVLRQFLENSDGTPLPMLRLLLVHDNADLRMLAARALGDTSIYTRPEVTRGEGLRYARARSVQALMDALGTEKAVRVRIAIIRSIVQYQDFAMQTGLVLKLTAFTDPDPAVRSAAQDALDALNKAP